MKKFLLLHGPNLNLLGLREPDIYGRQTLTALDQEMREYATLSGVLLECFQSNHEGQLVDTLQSSQGVYSGIIYNPGAHTHYSYAIRDAIASIDVPVVEVHISDVDAREDFRAISVVAPACVAQVKGKGFAGYHDAFDILLSGVTARLGEGFEKKYSEKIVIADRQEEISDQSKMGIKIVKMITDQVKLDTHIPVADSLLHLKRLRALLLEKKIQAVFVRDQSNIIWLTGFDGVFDSEDAHAMFIAPNLATLHTDSRYSEACDREAAHGPMLVDASRKTHAIFAADCLKELQIEGNSSEQSCAVLGVESSMELGEYRALEQVLDGVSPRPTTKETTGLIVGLRSVKDAAELARMKAAQAITDVAFSHIVSFMRPGMTEREVQIELESFMFRSGASGLAFSSIVATGANGASPHAIPGNTVLEAGQCVVLDFGAKAWEYCSDMTRVVFLGKPEATMQRAWETLRRANEEVVAMLKPGISGAAAHAHAEQVLAAGGFAGSMGHGLGHGVGIDIHEEPMLSPRNTADLVPGNVVTVEPGIYIPGEFGMRLEDFGVVTENGFEIFTQSTHEMVII